MNPTGRTSPSVAESLGIKAKRSKYRNVKTVVDGVTFDSRAEAKRWSELKRRESAGEIKFLRRQTRYPLNVNGQWICVYVSDHDFYDVAARKWVTEDVKGVLTAAYRLKKKLMKAIHGIDVVEIGAKRGRRNRRGRSNKRRN